MNRSLLALLLLSLTACGASSEDGLRLYHGGEWREFEEEAVSLAIVEGSTRDYLEVQGRADDLQLTLRVFLEKEVLHTGPWTLPIRGHIEVPANVRQEGVLPVFQATEGHSEGVQAAWVLASCGAASEQGAPAPQFMLGRLELTENTPQVVAGWLELTMDGQVAGACGGSGVKLVRHFRLQWF